jgi:hypothetical protein
MYASKLLGIELGFELMHGRTHAVSSQPAVNDDIVRCRGKAVDLEHLLEEDSAVLAQGEPFEILRLG